MSISVFSQQSETSVKRLTLTKVEKAPVEDRILDLQLNIKQIQEKINAIKTDPLAYKKAVDEGYIIGLEKLMAISEAEIKMLQDKH